MFQQTSHLFSEFVPDAHLVEGSGQYQIEVDGIVDPFRLKRGMDQVNQNHVHYGEPLVVHVPAKDEVGNHGSWYVLSIRWLISYALAHPDSRQHTVHALDCFMFPSSQLALLDPVAPTHLPQAIAGAIRESREESVRRAVRAIRRARTFSLTHFEEAADTAAVALGFHIPQG
jgi:hypothetical protein